MSNRLRMAATGLVLGVLLIGVLSGPAGALPHDRSRVKVTFGSDRLTDLSPDTADVTDGAWATAFAVSVAGRGTRVALLLTGLDRGLAGGRYGAHVHTGPCEAGNGAAAGPHYNSTGGAVVDSSTEVWLDISVSPWGIGFSNAAVPFEIPAGAARSIVVHAMPTAPGGAAGARLACLPMGF